MIEIKPLTLNDYIGFYKEKPPHTVRGYSISQDGNLAAIIGALVHKEQLVLFSDIKDGVSVSAIVIWRWAKRALSGFNDSKLPVYTTSPNSGRLLESLGFIFEGDTKYGKLYKYCG